MMQMKLTDLRFCLDQANEVSEQYRRYVLGAPHTSKSVMDLLWMFGEHLDKKIETVVLRKALPYQSIRGLYMRLGDRYVIVTGQLDMEWRRFVVCKELFHVALDKPEYRVEDIHGHLQEVTITFPVSESAPGPGVVSEAMAEIAAMQFLFPYREREALLRTKPCDFEQVAQRYGIPAVHIERYLSEPYMKFFGALEPSRPV